MPTGALSTSEASIFHYPFKCTPAFLINLPQPADREVALKAEDGREYIWKGGVGEKGTVVAYSAICAHQLAYPSRDVSPIRYSAETSTTAKRAGMIVCCAHNSVYDPAQGARVLGGQATQPLAAVVLEHDAESDELMATGIIGAQRFDDFFRAYKRDLSENYGPGAARQEARETAGVVPMSRFSGDIITC